MRRKSFPQHIMHIMRPLDPPRHHANAPTMHGLPNGGTGCLWTHNAAPGTFASVTVDHDELGYPEYPNYLETLIPDSGPRFWKHSSNIGSQI
eukprot:2190949-Prymnesium_polylepis.1